MQWPGLMSDVNPHDLPPGGAQIQDNFQCVKPGVLQVRKGLRPATFEEDTGATAQVIAAYGFRPPTRHYAAFQTSDGKVYLGNLPAANQPLETGVSAYHPSSFAQDRFGKLIRVNGLQRGTIYDGKNVWKLGITAPSSAPTISASGSGSITGSYSCGYRYKDAQGNYSSLSALSSVSASSSDHFEWAIAASTETDAAGSTYRVSVVELFRSTAGQSTTVYLVATIGNRGLITSSADNGSGNVQFTLPSGHNLVVGAKIEVTGHSVAAYNTTHEVTAVTDTTVDTDIAYTSSGTGGTWTISGYVADDADDSTLQDSTALPIYNPDGTVNARRYDVPSAHFQVAVPFQDRMFYLVPLMLSLDDYQNNVSDWTTEIVGRYIYRDGYRPEQVTAYSEPGGTPTLSLSESGDVAVSTLVSAGAQVYGDPSERNLLVYSEQDLPEAVPAAQNQVVIQENTDDNDALVGAIPAGSTLYLCKERHTYRASFVRQPAIDMIPTLAFYRGLLNQQCWDFLGDTVYLWDQLGAWAISPRGMEALSGPVQDYFRDGEIDWSKKKWFFTSAEVNEGVVRFHLALTGDGGTYPTRALCYCPATKAWWTESYQIGLAGKCRIVAGDAIRTLVGGPSGKMLLLNEGASDWVDAVTGTATSATANTLTDSNANFGTDVVGAPVCIVWGTGRGQVRVISARPSTTQIQVSEDWDITPDTTSQYAIGAIPATYHSGPAIIPEVERREDSGQRVLAVLYPPTSGNHHLLAEAYLDDQTSPEVMRGGGSIDRVVVTDGESAAKVPLKLQPGSLGDAPGYARLPWRLKARRKGESRRYFSLSLSCYQTDERLAIYGLEWQEPR